MGSRRPSWKSRPLFLLNILPSLSVSSVGGRTRRAPQTGQVRKTIVTHDITELSKYLLRYDLWSPIFIKVPSLQVIELCYAFCTPELRNHPNARNAFYRECLECCLWTWAFIAFDPPNLRWQTSQINSCFFCRCTLEICRVSSMLVGKYASGPHSG